MMEVPWRFAVVRTAVAAVAGRDPVHTVAAVGTDLVHIVVAARIAAADTDLVHTVAAAAVDTEDPAVAVDRDLAHTVVVAAAVGTDLDDIRVVPIGPFFPQCPLSDCQQYPHFELHLLCPHFELRRPCLPFQLDFEIN